MNNDHAVNRKEWQSVFLSENKSTHKRNELGERLENEERETAAEPALREAIGRKRCMRG